VVASAFSCGGGVDDEVVEASPDAGATADAGGVEAESSSPCAAPTACPLESYCAIAGTRWPHSCGPPWSPYDADGCARQGCTRAADCLDGQRCVDTAVTFPSTCWPSSGSCSYSDEDGCRCVDTFDCRAGRIYRTHCVDAVAYPVSSECDVTALSCEQLSFRLEEITVEYEYQASRRHEELVATLEACAQRLREALGDC
jgi:hypothetical protein